MTECTATPLNPCQQLYFYLRPTLSACQVQMMHPQPAVSFTPCFAKLHFGNVIASVNLHFRTNKIKQKKKKQPELMVVVCLCVSVCAKMMEIDVGGIFLNSQNKAGEEMRCSVAGHRMQFFLFCFFLLRPFFCLAFSSSLVERWVGAISLHFVQLIRVTKAIVWNTQGILIFFSLVWLRQKPQYTTEFLWSV